MILKTATLGIKTYLYNVLIFILYFKRDKNNKAQYYITSDHVYGLRDHKDIKNIEFRLSLNSNFRRSFKKTECSLIFVFKKASEPSERARKLCLVRP